MMRRILLAATGLALSLPVAAWSQTPSAPITGLYVGAGVGWNYLQSEQLKNFATQSAVFGGVSVNNKSVNFGSGLATVALARLGLRQRPACRDRGQLPLQQQQRERIGADLQLGAGH